MVALFVRLGTQPSENPKNAPDSPLYLLKKIEQLFFVSCILGPLLSEVSCYYGQVFSVYFVVFVQVGSAVPSGVGWIGGES